jgi:hypothetical protein
MAVYSDLVEIKQVLGIDPTNTTQDVLLGFYNTWAANIIELALNRGEDGLFKKSRTIYVNGTGTQRLLLPHRPIYTTPTPQVWEDMQNGLWGQGNDAFNSDPLTYGSSYVVIIDGANGLGNSGILFKNNGYWELPYCRQAGYLSTFVGQGRGNIKVTYTAGMTVDNMPPTIRMAADLLVARLSYIFPLGIELGGESYEERSISLGVKDQNYLLSLVKPLLYPMYRNWRW